MSANTDQNHNTTISTPHSAGNGFLRRSMAAVLLAGVITATAVGLAASSLADDGPDIDIAGIVPAPAVPWIPTFDRFGGHRDLHCTLPGWRGPFRCW